MELGVPQYLSTRGVISQFVCGYTEAMLEALDKARLAYYHNTPGRPVPVRLDSSFIAPETTMIIVNDCAAWRRIYPKVEDTNLQGRNFWRYRTEQLVERPDFPPLTPRLDTDGKVTFIRDISKCFSTNGWI